MWYRIAALENEMEYPNNLLACRIAARMSQMKVAAELDISQSEYSRMEIGRRQVGPHADKLAEIFGVSKERLLEYNKLDSAPPENGYTTNQLPIFGKRIVGQYCMLEFDQEPIEMVDKPSSLASNKDAYGVYVPGDSLEPRVKTGDLLYVEPHQPVRKDDLVVVGYGEDGPREILVYQGQSGDKIILFRANPEEVMKVDSADIKTLERVSGVKFL
jgi:transcriptional regulator with XRE-family HTH domain